MRNNTLRERAERGQAMVLIALSFVGLAAFIGLAVDAGILFSNVGHLRRATDAAALAAANQFREGWDPPDLSAEALEMLDLNGIDSGTATAWVCDLSNFPGAPLFSAFHDPTLCPGGIYPFSSSDGTPKKVVRVEAQMPVNFAFLPIIGFDSTTIHANAESEAASIDLVLALDVSNSMSIDLCYDGEDNDGDGTIDECSETTGPGSEGNLTFDDDVPLCSTFQSSPWPLIPPGVEPASPDAPDNACWPFEAVRYAAHRLVERMYFPYDRLSIVTFGRLPKVWLELDDTDSLPSGCIASNPKACAHKVLDDIQVEPSPLPDPTLCDQAAGGSSPKGCLSTNIGDGLLQAGARFCIDDGPPVKDAGNGVCDRGEMREEAVWIVLLLTDGAANAAIAGGDPAVFSDWICPDTTYPPTSTEPPWCRDDSASTRHASGDSGYDADDYARDQADNVGCPGPVPGETPPLGCPAGGGVGSVIFAIGLGKNVTENPGDLSEPRAGEFLLRYIADVGTDGLPNNDPFCNPDPGKGESCGNYYFAPEGDDLIAVFEDIASRIFTRITH